MKREQVCLLSELGVRPSRKLGQNFLVDRNVLGCIADSIIKDPVQTVIEIGSGTGVLTDRILASGKQLTAVEYDHRLVGYLHERYATANNFRLIADDACRVDYVPLIGDANYLCVGNLPYAISTKLIARFLALANRPQAFYVLLQEEMALRLTAKPGCKEYGAITVILQSRYEVRIRRRVSRTVFWPVPEVDSAFVSGHRRVDVAPSSEASHDEFTRLVKTSFSHRRKKLVTVLSSAYDTASVANAFQTLGLSEQVRAEELDVDQFNRLAALVCPRHGTE